jgi:hypothetical protein
VGLLRQLRDEDVEALIELLAALLVDELEAQFVLSPCDPCPDRAEHTIIESRRHCEQ